MFPTYGAVTLRKPQYSFRQELSCFLLFYRLITSNRFSKILPSTVTFFFYVCPSSFADFKLKGTTVTDIKLWRGLGITNTMYIERSSTGREDAVYDWFRKHTSLTLDVRLTMTCKLKGIVNSWLGSPLGDFL